MRTLGTPFLLLIALLGTIALTSRAAAQSTRSSGLAGALELFLPTAGFAYAGEWTRGLLPNAVRIGSVVGIVSNCDPDRGDRGTCAAFAGVLLASHIWATVGAANAARDRNRSMGAAAPGLVVLQGPADGALSVGLQLTR